MGTEAFLEVINASAIDRSDLFLTAAQRLGAPLINIEKDFWVCWTLDHMSALQRGHSPWFSRQT